MKSFKQTSAGHKALATKYLIAGVALAAFLGLTVNAQAQTCVVDNWLGGQPGLTNANAGTQDTASSDNRRYGGPCGLRVPVDGTVRHVSDNSPATEATYIARFYVFLDNAPAGPIVLFAADDGTTDRIQVIYDSGDLMLSVYDANIAGMAGANFTGIGSGWHSVEFEWTQAASATINFSVNGAADEQITGIDTSGYSIANAYLGNVAGAGGGGSIDFDDFDSRRVDRPGRLCRGLTDDARVPAALNLEDVINIFNEFASNGNTPAGGQPDFNEDGTVDLSDVIDVFNRFATANEDCSLNS